MTEPVQDFSDPVIFFDQRASDSGRIGISGTDIAVAANGRYITVAGGIGRLAWSIIDADGEVSQATIGGETVPLTGSYELDSRTFRLLDVSTTNENSYLITYQLSTTKASTTYIAVIDEGGILLGEPKTISGGYAISEGHDPDGDGALNYRSLSVYSSDGNIYGILIDSSGARINNPVMLNIGDDILAQDFATVSSLRSGQYVVAWQTKATDSSGNISARIIDSNGQPTGTLIDVNSATNGSQSSPSVAGLTNGNFVVAWVTGTVGSGTGRDLRFRVFGQDGQPISSEKAVNTSLAGEQYQAKILVTDDGKFAIAWREDSADSTDNDLYLIKYFESDGDPIGDSLKLFETSKVNADVEFAMLADGRIALTWIADEGSASSVDALTKIVDPRTSGIVKNGTADGDWYFGTDFSDTLRGLGGDDHLQGMDGDDTLQGGAGADILEGGLGSDTARYIDATAAVSVYMSSMANNTGDADGDSFNSIENVVGSNYNDVISGSSRDNVLSGGNGNDRLFGNSGNDILKGNHGADDIDGGSGLDIADYSDDTVGFVGDLLDPDRDTGRIAADVLTSIEGLIGSKYNDDLSGTNDVNVLSGGSGADRLVGRGGNDRLTGGGGADKFVLNGPGQGVDVITDFDPTTGDKLVISISDFGGTLQPGTGTSSTLPGADLIRASDYAPTSGKSTFFYDRDDGALYFDVDGTGASQAVQIATLTGVPALHGFDFLIV